MTRYAIVADLNRCVGCQTCTAACKHANATAPGIQWRKVLDIEAGEFPDVRRAFMPVGCMQCDEPPCLDVCPSTATGKRDDGIVTIDYDLCIGCAYCAVACPYQARSRVDAPSSAYGNGAMRHEAAREDPARLGVAQKCTFCIDRIDAGLAAGLVPGVDLEATPACVGSCIAGALHFGDVEDPDSNVSRLLRENRHFRMHEELGTGPGFYYLWDGNDDDKPAVDDGAELVADPAGMPGVAPVQQQSWDWRAAANFVFGGAGSGLLVTSALASLFGHNVTVPVFAGLALIGLGLFCVWLEIGRPWRFINVYFHAKRSWMTREAIVALPLMAFGLLSLLSGSVAIIVLTGMLATAFAYCQARILKAAKGIPAWREEGIMAVMLSTALVEGTGLLALFATVAGFAVPALQGLTGLLVLAVMIRLIAWRQYRAALGASGAPTGTFRAFDSAFLRLGAGHQVPIAVVAAAGWLAGDWTGLFLGISALVAIASGWDFKLTLVTRAGFNQGYAIRHMPARGSGTAAAGIKPGWTTA